MAEAIRPTYDIGRMTEAELELTLRALHGFQPHNAETGELLAQLRDRFAAALAAATGGA
jgi:hypothetical protein